MEICGGGGWEVETTRRRGGENLGSLHPSVGIRGIGGGLKISNAMRWSGETGRERGEDVVVVCVGVGGGKTTRRREMGQVVSETWE